MEFSPFIEQRKNIKLRWRQVFKAYMKCSCLCFEKGSNLKISCGGENSDFIFLLSIGISQFFRFCD